MPAAYHWYFATLDVGLLLAAAFGLAWLGGTVGERVPPVERWIGVVALIGVVVYFAKKSSESNKAPPPPTIKQTELNENQA